VTRGHPVRPLIWYRKRAPATPRLLLFMPFLRISTSPRRSNQAKGQNQPGRRAGNRTGGKIMMVVGMLSLEECYRNVPRYAAGVMPMARRNARVKFDPEENWQASAISDSDARPVAIIALALSSRRPLT
jgi:hypothetical protein